MKKNAISNVTKETRRQAYEHVLETLSLRQHNVYQSLKEFPEGVTARELASYMYEKGLVPSPERNSVHPRLNELIELGLVEIIGKTKCQFSNRKVAVYKIKNNDLMEE